MLAKVPAGQHRFFFYARGKDSPLKENVIPGEAERFAWPSFRNHNTKRCYNMNSVECENITKTYHCSYQATRYYIKPFLPAMGTFHWGQVPVKLSPL